MMFSKSYGGHRNTLGLTHSAVGKIETSQQLWKKNNTEEENVRSNEEPVEL